MIVLRIFWALFLSGMVAYTFHRAWRWEHGAPMPEPILGDKPRTKETVVWVEPTFLPILLLTILILSAAIAGKEGVERFLSLSLDVMLVISMHFLLLVFLLPVLRRYFSARACATMWVLPVFMFWQAHVLLDIAPVPTFVIYIPSHVLSVLFLLWGIGFAVVFGGKCIAHWLFRHRVMSVSVPVEDKQVLELFESELQALEYYRGVRLVISPAVSVPLSMGTTTKSRVTVLPDRTFTQQELQFIFRHEIHHLRRRDVHNKIFFAFCQALCWFNPLIWVATRKASDDLELSCDEIVLEGMDEQTRRQYAELLLDTAGQSGGFTTCLSAAAETMRYRLKNVVSVRKRLPGTALLAAAMFLCVMSYGLIAVSEDRGTVAELITEYRTADNVKQVYYRSEEDGRSQRVYDWDREGLFAYLTSLPVERLGGVKELHDIGGWHSSVVVEGNTTMELTFYDQLVEVHHYARRSYPEYYYLRSAPDWDRIAGYLDLEAEPPEENRVLDPQMRMYFDGGFEEPLTAVRQRFRAMDMETGETLRAFDNSDEPGGVRGMRCTQVELEADMPVSQITLWVRDWASDEWTETAVEGDGTRFSLLLEPHSAHYMVDVVYEPYAGIASEATYVFDVELP
ncbi:MAG: M56 family metallopeptidase [Ruminococcaceae bacterium]|nr:M56 family metallopeptidase [Oscillospiraceae bacterium]